MAPPNIHAEILRQENFHFYAHLLNEYVKEEEEEEEKKKTTDWPTFHRV